jgi:oxygen-independent coproporphyrinogen III oxidase
VIEYLYLHFPFCRHLCNYCDFYKKVPKDTRELERYHQYLTQSAFELDKLLLAENEKLGELKSLYLGGGTPSLWGSEGARFIQKFLAERGWSLRADSEVTLEVNPGSWTVQGLSDWWEFGANRTSLGIQSLDATFLKLLDRVHSLADVYETLEYFGNSKINFSVDFMLGLPYSEKHQRNIGAELERILSFNPSHLSLYILKVPKHYPHFSQLPDDEWIEHEYLEVSRYLTERGFIHYEVSNFAKPGLESQHNLAYWRNDSVGALGPSATGYLAKSKLRYKWKTEKPEFEVERLTHEQVELEKLYLGLRTNRGISLESYFPEHELALGQLVERWQNRGLVLGDKTHCTPTAKGFLLMDSLMDDLFGLN